MGIPKFVLENTKHFTSRTFKEDKRFLLKKMKNDLEELRRGSAWFPEAGLEQIYEIAAALKILSKKLSVQNWGR